MPGIDSAEATKRIVTNLPDVRVIGLSSDFESQTAIMDAGTVAFVDKTSEDLYLICETIRWAAQ